MQPWTTWATATAEADKPTVHPARRSTKTRRSDRSQNRQARLWKTEAGEVRQQSQSQMHASIKTDFLLRLSKLTTLGAHTHIHTHFLTLEMHAMLHKRLLLHQLRLGLPHACQHQQVLRRTHVVPQPLCPNHCVPMQATLTRRSVQWLRKKRAGMLTTAATTSASRTLFCPSWRRAYFRVSGTDMACVHEECQNCSRA